MANSVKYREQNPEFVFVELHWRPTLLGFVNGVPLVKSPDWWDMHPSDGGSAWECAEWWDEVAEEIALAKAGAPNPIQYAIQ